MGHSTPEAEKSCAQGVTSRERVRGVGGAEVLDSAPTVKLVAGDAALRSTPSARAPALHALRRLPLRVCISGHAGRIVCVTCSEHPAGRGALPWRGGLRWCERPSARTRRAVGPASAQRRGAFALPLSLLGPRPGLVEGDALRTPASPAEGRRIAQPWRSPGARRRADLIAWVALAEALTGSATASSAGSSVSSFER